MAWKFAIRDDDTMFYTKPEELEYCYDGIFNICPISLSVVPFLLPRKPNLPYNTQFWVAEGPNKPLGENVALVSWLKARLARGQVSITLHGYEHDIPSKIEFGTGDYAGLKYKVLEGKSYLEKLLDTQIRVFVPPQNQLSQAGLEAVVSAGLNICPVQPMRIKRSRRMYNFLLQRWYVTLRKMQPPHPLFFGSHYEIPMHHLGPRANLRTLEEALKKQAQAGGLFVLALHYWEADEKLADSDHTLKEAVRILLDHATSTRDCCFVSLNSLC